MKTYYAFIEGEICPLRLPITEVKRNKWGGHLVATTLTGIAKLINRGE